MSEKDDQELEKGFNDSELADIMSEIETLEKDLEEETEETPDNTEIEDEVTMESEEGAGSYDDIENTIEVPEAEIVDDMPAGPVRNVVSMNTPVSSASSRMDFSVEGDMKINLNFHISGQDVKLFVDGKNGLVIELSSGARFTVPIDTPLKKVG